MQGGRSMAKRSTTVGLDVHKVTIDVVVAEAGADGEVRHFGTIGGDLRAVDRMVKQLRAAGRRLHFVYEAGPCGFHLYRHLRAQGLECTVVSPSMTPKRSGDRIKTDRRDAEALARLHRAGELRGIYIPGPDDEAFRDLVRAREDAVTAQNRARHRLKALLLRHGYRYEGRAAWTLRYRQWLSNLKFSTAAQQIALQEYIDTIGEAEARVGRLTDQIRTLVPEWEARPGGGSAAGAARRIDGDGGHAGGGDRRPDALLQSAPAHGVLGARPLRVLQRRQASPWGDHQGGQRARPAGAGRVGVGLSRAGSCRASAAVAAERPSEAHRRHRLEGAASPHRALPSFGGSRQVAAQDRHRHRARAHRLRMGPRAARRSGLNSSPTTWVTVEQGGLRAQRHSERVALGGGAPARRRTLEDVTGTGERRHARV